MGLQSFCAAQTVTLLSMLSSLSPQLQQQAWLKLSPMPRTLLPEPWRNWVLDSGSLTQRLKNLTNDPKAFSVQLNRIEFTRASLSEARALNIPFREQVYVREVTLMLRGEPVVVARSVIPRSTLTGYERQLMRLGNKPLGEFLFNHKHMKRHAIECKQGQVSNQKAWARRSVFELSGKPLMVSEVFLEHLLAL